MTACGCEEEDAAVPRLRPHKPETQPGAQPPLTRSLDIGVSADESNIGTQLSNPQAARSRGAEVSADESITACGCEEVDAAVPRLRPRKSELHLGAPLSPAPSHTITGPTPKPRYPLAAARSSHHSPGYTNPHCRRTSVSTDITSRLSVSCRTSSSGIGVSTPASRSDGGTPSPSPWRVSR